MIKCDVCGKVISKFESKNCLDMCIQCFADCCRFEIRELLEPLIYDMASNYVALMKEQAELGWEDLDGFEDKDDAELTERLCEKYSEKHSVKA